MTEKLPRDMTENEVRYHCAALYDDIERLTAENERMRELIKEAADHIDGVCGARSRPNSDSGELVSRLDALVQQQAKQES